ncbi:STAS domain-containing protein [Streptacidiphilus sp. PAMC 29251]
MSSEELSFTLLQRHGAQAVVQVSGAMDYDTSAPLEQSLAGLLGNGARHLVLDMGAVTFCDSSGINALLRVLARAKQDQGSLALAAVTTQVQHVLQTIGVDAVITLYPTITLALDSTPA